MRSCSSCSQAALPGGSYSATMSEQRETISLEVALQDRVARERRQAQVEAARQPRPGRLVEAVHGLVLVGELAAQAGDVVVAARAAPRAARSPPRAHAAGLEDLARVLDRRHRHRWRRGCGRSSTMWSWASRCSTLRTTERLTPNISHSDDSGSLVPGASRWLHDAVEHRLVDGGLDAFGPCARRLPATSLMARPRARPSRSRSAPGRCRRAEQGHADRKRCARCRGGERHAHLRQARQSGDAGDRHRPQTRRRRPQPVRHRGAVRRSPPTAARATPSTPIISRTRALIRAAARDASSARNALIARAACHRAAIAGAKRGCARSIQSPWARQLCARRQRRRRRRASPPATSRRRHARGAGRDARRPRAPSRRRSAARRTQNRRARRRRRERSAVAAPAAPRAAGRRRRERR